MSRYRLEEPVRIGPRGPFAFYAFPDGYRLKVKGGDVYVTYVATEKVFNGEKVLEPEIAFHPDNYTPHRIRLTEGPYHQRKNGLQVPEEEVVTEKKQKNRLPLEPDLFPIGGDFELE